MTRSQIQLPGLDVGIPFFLPSWVVLPLALCFGGGSKGSASSVYANQQQKAPPAPPPAPPKASEATAATKYLIRDIASQRSRQTTVLTRERTKLIPGQNGSLITRPTPAVDSTVYPVPPWVDTPVPQRPGPAPDNPTIYGTPEANPVQSSIGGPIVLGPQWAGPGGWLPEVIAAADPLSPTFGQQPISPAFVDDHKPFNGTEAYLA